MKSTISRAVALKRILEKPSLREMVSKLGSLPTLPEVYQRLTQVLESEDASVEEIGEIISQDLAMTANILKVVNSSFFGLTRRITSPAQAVGLLGLNTIQAIVLTTHLFETVKGAHPPDFSLPALWRHSLLVAVIARRIALEERLGVDQIEEAFMAGLLHDVGKVIFATKLADEYRRCLETAEQDERPLWNLEGERLGATHAEVGTYLMGLRGMNEAVVQAIVFHHGPSLESDIKFNPLACVHLADFIERLEGDLPPKEWTRG